VLSCTSSSHFSLVFTTKWVSIPKMTAVTAHSPPLA
jgi:hypothetical protein